MTTIAVTSANFSVAVLAAFIGALIGCKTVSSASSAFPEVRTSRLLLVDEQGQVCGGFEVGRGSSKAVTLWLKRGDDSGSPSVTVSIDELEDTPSASISVRTSGVDPTASGVGSLKSTSGYARVSLSQNGSDHQNIVLGPRHWEDDAALSLDRGGATFTWPE